MMWLWLLVFFYLVVGIGIFVCLLTMAYQQNSLIIRSRTIMASLAIICLFWPLFWAEIVK